MRDTTVSMLPCKVQTAQVGGGHKKWSRGPGQAQDGGGELLGRVAGTEVWEVWRGGPPGECAGWETRKWEAVDSTPKEGDSVIW